jgi:hypothetical protein
MLKKVLLIAATLGFSGAALAHPPHWAPAHGYRGHYGHEVSHYRPHYVAPRPVYVAPRPVYVVPAPRVVYAHPAPVAVPAPVYPPAAVYGTPSVSIRLNLPL